MKIKVNVINTWSIIVTEEVTVPNLMMTSAVSEELLVRDTQTHTYTVSISSTQKGEDDSKRNRTDLPPASFPTIARKMYTDFP